MDAYIS